MPKNKSESDKAKESLACMLAEAATIARQESEITLLRAQVEARKAKLLVSFLHQISKHLK